MTNKEKERFFRALGTIAEVHGKEVSTQLGLTYFEALKEWSIEDVERGISAAIVSLKFWPKPVELVELISGETANVEDKALVEAGKVLDAVRRVGSYKSVKFDDPTTAAVIIQGFGGWIQMCSELTVENEKWWQKDFVKIYASYKRAKMEHHGYLLGIAETQNISNGFEHNEAPELIGGPEKKLLN